MPLVELSAEDAIANRKSNPFATWGDRTAANRIEPVAKPAFDVPFRLEPGESIFTVGSCFARNVEAELLKRGFVLPMREIFKKPEFQGVEVGAINNFGTPSIYNEFAWALGERPFRPEDHIVEIQPGKFADLHLIPSMRPDAWETVISRRKAITQAFESVKRCRVLIMTLGLVEVWYDSQTDYYLNVAPRPSLIRSQPSRFRLHVLSFDECYKYLEETLLLVKKFGREDFRVLMTVSPVPLMATHRNQDVMVANSYSKSVLRSVAETIVERHDFISYYPSYESVTLSDRRIAWKDDFVHVTEEIVALNVSRMVDAFVGTLHDPDVSRDEIAAGGIAVAIEKAQLVRRGSQDAAMQFFSEFGEFSCRSVEFAVEHAGFLTASGDIEGALKVLKQAPQVPVSERAAVLIAEAHMSLGDPQEAVIALDPVAESGSRSYAVWNTLLKAAISTDDLALIKSVLARWTRRSPNRAARANTLVGRSRYERGDVEGAVSYLRTALALQSDDGLARIYLAEALLADGRRDEARGLIENLRPATPTEVKLLSRLSLRVD